VNDCMIVSLLCLNGRMCQIFILDQISMPATKRSLRLSIPLTFTPANLRSSQLSALTHSLMPTWKSR
jgi:hypothetical protein